MFFACLTVVGQVNQVWWSKGRVLHVNPVAGIDSVTYGQFVNADTFLIVIDRASRRIVYDTVDVHVPGMVFHDTIRTTHTVYLNPGRRIGVFSVAKDKQVSFSQGNLQYVRNQDVWKFADQQYEYIGARNVKDGKLANKIDLFGWSGDNTTAPFGVSTSTNAADYSGDFVDWGVNEINGDAPNTWRTLTKDEWEYLFEKRKNAPKLYGVAQVNGSNGIIILPDNWSFDNGISFKTGLHSVETDDYSIFQSFTDQEFSVLESFGAIFIHASGWREGISIEKSQRSGYYWSSTPYNNTDAYRMTFYSYYLKPCDIHYKYRGRSVRLVHDTIVPKPEPEYVDLGLSVKWATFNVGASVPEDYGDYFAWGEVEPKEEYNWSSYKYCKGTNKTMTKYCSSSSYGNNGFTDTKTVLDLEDDAATVNWGGEWRMPTDAELTELRTKCTWTWTEQNGVNGYRVTGPNGNSIFLPAAGYVYDSSLRLAGSSGYYWSSSLDSSDPYYAYLVRFTSVNVYWTNDYRRYGFSVRPVMPTDHEPLPLPAPCETFEVNGVKFNMMCVEGGTFTWGADNPKDVRTRKKHQSTVSSFLLAETPVTQELWQAVMGENPSYHQCDTCLQHPVDSVSWNMAQKFIERLNQLTGRKFRLPTEEEWIFAMHGGVKSKGYSYAGSDKLSDVAWYSANANGQTHTVAQLRPNELGLYDMQGNVWEHTQDLYRDLTTSYPVVNGTGLCVGATTQNNLLVICGGAFYWTESGYSEENRVTGWMGRGNRRKWLGLRLALSDVDPFMAVEVDRYRFHMMHVEGEKYDYYIGQTEVTQGLWEKVMGYNNSIVVGDDLPVEKVSWDECQQFIGRLNEMTGLHFRLPTEAEWEYAARGGNRSRGCSYAGSNNIDSVGWYSDNSQQTTHAVASLMPNELGVYDMTGNVWEWCQDFYDAGQTMHVVKSGSWFDAATTCRINARTGRAADYQSYIGLRLVMDVHEYVDLGLSVKWATCNVGAMVPEEYGDYFAWGEVEPKDVYDWATYKWCDGTEQNITKYNAEDCLTTLLLEDDAAHANWGGEWRMPTKDEFQELIDYCTFEITQLNGVKGTWITSKINGNRIFVPYAGYYNHGNGGSADKNHLSQQRLWTSTKATRSTYAWNFYNQSNEGNTRRCGFPVRPVLPTERELLPPVVPGKRIGVFSVAKDKQVSFSQGNLQYVQSLNHWRFADNQLYYTGERHLRNGQIADTVMYFGWSAKDSPTLWGIGLETNVEKYKGEFLDWGVNEIQGDKANTWRTMSNDEWIYLFTERKNAAQLMGRGKVDDINGVILLPDNWVLPDGLSFAPIDDAVINHYTAEQWAKMESVGAVFIPAAGYFNNRLNPKMRFVGEYAYAASCNTLKDGVLQLYNAFTETTVSYSITGTSSTTLYYAFLRRLVHDTIVPPPAPCRTIEVNGVTFNMMCVDGEEYDYFVGQTEVTCSQWKAVMGSLPKGHTVGNKPIHSVTWGECQEFITKLNELTGLYFRFPTKDEWLYAAKGGQYKDDYLYSGSDDINQVGWYSDNSVGTGVHDVAKLKPNSLGIYDMTGNVWEWVESADGKHLYMGGSYAFKAESCLLSKTQGVASNDNHTGSIGIRLVLVINK